MSPSIVCTGLSFDWPDGTPVLTGLDAAFATGRTGLVGLNGSGKSTLLRLIAGDLAPTSGDAASSGEVGYLAQDVALHADRTVADLLGIAPVRAALRAVENGDAAPVHFAAIGDAWDVEERARAQLQRFGVAPAPDGGTDVLDRTVGRLSGGEAVLTGLAGLVLRRTAVTLLDEPTNNLDRAARHRLYDAVRSWKGVLIVVSHDRELLDLVDHIAELRDGSVHHYGGNYTDYTEQLAAEQEAAQRMARAAEADVRREQRQLVEARTKLDRRVRYGKKMYAQKREPRVIMKQRKREAEVSAGKHRIMQAAKVADAERSLADAEHAVRDDDRIRIDVARADVPAGRTVLEVRRPGATLSIRGPERVGVLGRNGSGKTTLLRAAAGRAELPGAAITRGGPVGYLPQRLDTLDDGISVLDNVRAAAPRATPHEVRAGLARFLIRGDRPDQPAGVLSGGERFRVSLACLLLAGTPPQLLILDEPTNSLDLHSVGQLTLALADYRGALLVAGHDLPFLRGLGITRWWSTDGGSVTETEAP
ncbi:ATPase subunit of ABC transporter with duplicated ATPase domains [Murinocardiopsis flavida]|uniref:ATPase subunit of ABC transporter with duplicated ATPase domains n=1 Tax=Murinocardiopsis flavida TaxID=645275 RepID=A0A2P8DGC9_9ACTN|nr:ABC-F family ATP-binding cassette domain-containing protein [Murinocardiopsis flavida]PSK96263.1 ATPase subunit of ABC transporter with duplicated ATPase domains [Murinocardiopsis flavida]